MDEKRTVSVIIPTKERPEDLMACLASIYRQTYMPSQVIVVEGGMSGTSKKLVRTTYPNAQFVEFPESTGLTSSRNRALSIISGEISIFLDDDVVLDEDFVEKITEVFSMEDFNSIGGVVGNMFGYKGGNDSFLHYLIKRLFLMPIRGDGRFRLSGAPTFIYGAKDIKQVEFIAGGISGYRTKIFDEFRFDENLKGSSLGEDKDFSYRISRKYRNYYTPFAMADHKQSPVNRTGGLARLIERSSTSLYLTRKNSPIILWPFGAIMIIGYFVEAAYFFIKKVFVGN